MYSVAVRLVSQFWVLCFFFEIPIPYLNVLLTCHSVYLPFLTLRRFGHAYRSKYKLSGIQSRMNVPGNQNRNQIFFTQ